MSFGCQLRHTLHSTSEYKKKELRLTVNTRLCISATTGCATHPHTQNHVLTAVTWKVDLKCFIAVSVSPRDTPHSDHHSVFCLTTVSKLPPKLFLHIV